MKKQMGFSIAEFLIAGTLGLFVLAGASQVYLSTRHSYDIQTQLSRLQENGRYLQYLLTKEIRMAGYQGCNHVDALAASNVMTNTPASLSLSPNTVINGYTNTGASWSPALPTWLSNNIAAGTSLKPDTDIIVITKMTAGTEQLTSSMSSEFSSIAINGNTQLQANEIVAVTDCETLDMFRVSQGSTATSVRHLTDYNTTFRLAKAYQTDAHIGRVERIAFYIKDTGRENSSGDTIYSLYRQNLSGDEEELIEGVEEMKILYGIDSNNDGAVDSYQAANAITANGWSNVASVQIKNLLNSIESAASQKKSFTFNGVTTSEPSDRLLRRQWDTFIRLRNFR